MVATPFPHESLMHVVRQLPAAPRVLIQLGAMLLELDSDLADVTALLRCDAALTARIIRISNSVSFNVGLPIGSLEQALLRIGFGEVYRITGIAVVTQVVDHDLALYGVTGPQLRKNRLFSALAMEALAEPAGLDPRIAYTAGLLRSVGKVALDRLTRDPAYSGQYPANGRWSLAEWERGFTGLSNCEAAATILNDWRFPAIAVAGVCGHYAPDEASGPLGYLLNLAAGAADRAGHGLPGEASYWELSDEKLAAARLDHARYESAVAEALAQFERLSETIA
jgi:HD-like signal output (HDOD) protein